MFALKTLSIPLTVTDGPKQWKRYRHRSGKWYWRNYRREVKGGVSLAERFRLTVEAVYAEQETHLRRVLWT